MIVGTILLTKDNHYVDTDGNLPQRPKHDKQLLSDLCKNQIVSDDAYTMLPLSIQKLVTVDNSRVTIPLTIIELDRLPHLLIVSRSTGTITDGKKFRLTNFRLILKDRKVELWMRIQ